MTAHRFSILLAGVGGQGLLTAARVLGDAAHDAGLNVVVGQLHGMSQRGGSVECSVLIGPGSSSYLTRADVVAGFEPLETLRALGRMDSETTVVMNRGKFVLPALVREKKPYPSLDVILFEIRRVAGEIVVIDGPGALREIGMMRSLNVFMLGTLVGLGLLPFDESTLWRAVTRRMDQRYRDANRKAYDLGRSSVITAGGKSGDGGKVLRGTAEQ